MAFDSPLDHWRITGGHSLCATLTELLWVTLWAYCKYGEFLSLHTCSPTMRIALMTRLLVVFYRITMLMAQWQVSAHIAADNSFHWLPPETAESGEIGLTHKVARTERQVNIRVAGRLFSCCSCEINFASKLMNKFARLVSRRTCFQAEKLVASLSAFIKERV